MGMIEPTMAGIRQALNHRSLSQFEQWWLVEQVETAQGERDALQEWQREAVRTVKAMMSPYSEGIDPDVSWEMAKRLLADRQS